MALSPKISEYIEKCKVNNRFLKWGKSIVNVYITQISATGVDKEFLYFQMRNAIANWNYHLKINYINIVFNETNTPQNADITIHWTKVGRIFEGMCKYPGVVNGELRKISIEIGLPNKYSGKNTTDDSIFFVMMHELGHSLGLGHGVEQDDLMFVPHQKNISKPSDNDIFALKKIYSA